MKKSFLLILLLILLPTRSYNSASQEPIITAQSSIIIDGEDGSVLYSENEEEVLGIASITKLMTVYIAIEEMEKKDLKLTDESFISEKAASIKFQAEDVSGVYFSEGQKVTNEQLIKLGLIFSDNGAMVQLAEVVSGSEENHVKLMNEKADEWNLKNTNFVNVTGLTMVDYGSYMLENSSPSDYNISTAIELSKMVFNIVHERPELLKITEQESYDFNGETVTNWNLMLPNKEFEYDGVKGLKTGSSVEAGYCFTSYYSKNEEESYITVVLNSETTYDRFIDTSQLLDWINMQSFEKILSKEETIPVKVDSNYTNLNPKYDVTSSENFLLNGYIDGIVYNDMYFNEEHKLIKTIPAGEIVAELRINKIDSETTSNVFSDGSILSVPLTSKEEIQKESFLKSRIVSIKTFIVEYISK